ncbi:glycosyltransferase [Rhodococcus fascians]|uniref:glycosyltransferase n=1 Tax=Rhodococcoides fascians TaxID=1828 RepID=UPI001C5D8933|nr:glycosyltransferase [Rhodococcus fascians]MBW4780766.1 glycosyltransferase [Rhodococcus fascians]
MTLVTIGLPFNSVNDDLLSAIRSVFKQSHENWELILYGDGVDGEDAAALTAINDPRVACHFSKHQRGLASALNAIAEMTSSEWLFRMDSDDLMIGTRIQKTLEYFSNFPNVDVVGSSAVVIDEENMIQGVLREVAMPTDPAGFLRSDVLAHPTIAARTSWFLANPYNTRFERAQDKELWLRTCCTSVFARLDEPQLFYRIKRSTVNAKVRRSAKFDRLSILMYGYRYAGLAQTVVRLAKSYLAQLRSEFHTVLGRGDESYEGRFWPIDEQAQQGYREEIQSIVRYELPQRPEASGKARF